MHFQLMDRPGILRAAGLPFRFVGAESDDGAQVDLPRNGRAFHACPSER
ncbi:MAG: hypothetical protein L0H64_11260 [Pseudonocardia sp.]|nr:hypothetical protein [Pseudonocardia sp.]